jgi:hypothetical protein
MKKVGSAVIKSRKDKAKHISSPKLKDAVLITPSDITRLKHQFENIQKVRPLKREEVYKIIDGERDYQEKKWNSITTSSKGVHSAGEWLTFIQDYLTEAMHITSRNSEPEATKMVMENIRKITAMGVAAMEQIETPPRK